MRLKSCSGKSLFLTLFSILALIFQVMPAQASYIKATTDAQSNEYGMYEIHVVDPHQSIGSTGTVTSSSTSGTGVASASASATAGYGELKAIATGWGGQLAGQSGQASGIATATFSDKWTISNTHLNGTLGNITFVFKMSGLTNGFGWANLPSRLSALAELRRDGDWYTRWQVGEDYKWWTTEQSELAYFTTSFYYGTPFTFEFSLSASAGGDAAYNRSAPSVSDFSHTALLDSIDVFSGQTEVTAYSLTTESGALYAFQQPPVTTPEPATVLLLGLGLVGLAGVRRKFKK